MKKCLGWIAAVALASVTASAGARETNPPPTGGTISIEPTAVEGGDASMSAFVDATAAAFTARGFTVINAPGHAASAVELLVSRVDVGTGVAKVRGEAPSALGMGIAIPLSNGGSEFVSLQRTRLEIRIRKRGGGVVWDGSAITVRGAGTRKGSPETVATDLSQALLQSYPAQSKEVVGVP